MNNMPSKPKPPTKIRNPELINLLARKEVNDGLEIRNIQKRIINNLSQNFKKRS